jgi:hypothetical protein
MASTAMLWFDVLNRTVEFEPVGDPAARCAYQWPAPRSHQHRQRPRRAHPRRSSRAPAEAGRTGPQRRGRAPRQAQQGRDVQPPILQRRAHHQLANRPDIASDIVLSPRTRKSLLGPRAGPSVRLQDHVGLSDTIPNSDGQDPTCWASLTTSSR